jgi:hypothetical protein
MVRKLWPGYIALYRSASGDEILIKTLDPPPEIRKFKAVGGVRKYKRVKYKQHLQEVIVVARATKKSAQKANQVTDDELDELETVDDLEDLEDVEDDEPEDEDDDEEDEEDEDDDDEEEEAPRPKRKAKAKSKARASRAKQNGRVGTAEIAEASGVDSRRVRMVLRKRNVPKDEETGRYEWASLNDKTVKKILKWLEAGEADEIVKESLDNLKAKKAAKKADAKANTKKAGKKNKKKKVVDDDE